MPPQSKAPCQPARVPALTIAAAYGMMHKLLHLAFARVDHR